MNKHFPTLFSLRSQGKLAFKGTVFQFMHLRPHVVCSHVRSQSHQPLIFFEIDFHIKKFFFRGVVIIRGFFDIFFV